MWFILSTTVCGLRGRCEVSGVAGAAQCGSTSVCLAGGCAGGASLGGALPTLPSCVCAVPGLGCADVAHLDGHSRAWWRAAASALPVYGCHFVSTPLLHRGVVGRPRQGYYRLTFLLVIFFFLVMFSFAADEWIGWVRARSGGLGGSRVVAPRERRQAPLCPGFACRLPCHVSLCVSAVVLQAAITSMFGFMIVVDLVFMGGGNSFVYDPDYKVMAGGGFRR